MMARTGGDGGRKSPRTADAEDPDVHERLGGERLDATEAAAIEPRRHLVLARRGRRPFKATFGGALYTAVGLVPPGALFTTPLSF